MAVAHKTVSVGTTDTEMHVAKSAENVYVRAPASLSDNVYLGGSGVTTSDYGLRLAPDETSPLIPLRSGDALHGVTDGVAAIDVQMFHISAIYV